MNQRGHALLSDDARRPAALLAAGCALATAVLGTVEYRARAGPFDTRIDAWIVRLFGHRDRLILDMRDLGNPRDVTICCAAAVLACLLTRRYRAALLVAIAVPLASALTEFVFKPLVGRTFVGFLSFPSGHVTGVGALAFSLIVVFFGPSARPLPAAVRWLLATSCVLAVVDITLAVVAGQYHYFTDTVGGAGVALVTALTAALALDWAAVRLGRRREGAAAPRNPGASGLVGTGMSSGHQITITPADAHIEVSLGGEKVADSRRALVLAETGLPPRYYLPREDVRTDLLRPTATQSTCPFKGQASYWSAEVGGEVHTDIVWSYETPIPEAAGIAGLMCFWSERGAEVTVDGVPAARASAPSPH